MLLNRRRIGLLLFIVITECQNWWEFFLLFYSYRSQQTEISWKHKILEVRYSLLRWLIFFFKCFFLYSCQRGRCSICFLNSLVIFYPIFPSALVPVTWYLILYFRHIHHAKFSCKKIWYYYFDDDWRSVWRLILKFLLKYWL